MLHTLEVQVVVMVKSSGLDTSQLDLDLLWDCVACILDGPF